MTLEQFDSGELNELIKGHCSGIADSVHIHEFVRQVQINTWKAAYEAGHADALKTIPVFESNNLK